MGVFDSKNFNSEVFGKYLETVPRVKQNALLKAGVLRTRGELKAMLSEQTGGNFISVPMSGRIGGDVLNYDGNTDITATGLETFLQSMIVCGRAKAWKEKDFTKDITGKDFMEVIAAQVGDYFDDVDTADLLAILKGIFGVTTDSFSTSHTYDISDDATAANQYVGASTLNSAVQKAAGANKDLFKVAIMHSVVATALENQQLLQYWKYTDADGVERPLNIGSWNGRTVLVDDDAPVLHGYDASTNSTPGALKVVASSATTGQINLADVTGSDFYPANVAANDYVIPGVKYVTYVLGEGAFDYCDCGANVPSETWRDPKTKGGEDWLITRQRKLFAPHGFSFVQADPAIVSPTPANLATTARWDIVKDTNSVSRGYYPSKAIPFARIISRG